MLLLALAVACGGGSETPSATPTAAPPTATAVPVTALPTGTPSPTPPLPASSAPPDRDLLGLALRPEPDGSYSVIAVATKDGKPSVDGVEPGDKLLEVDSLKATGATMGTVVDALRGAPGDTRTLLLERNGKRFKVVARVERFLR